MDDEQKNKTHKNKTTGNKALKKDVLRKKKAGIELEPNRGSNVKAFQSVSANSHKAQKFFRSVEKRESTLHMPTIDKTFRDLVTEPPLLVAVVGPPNVGKTTLIRSLVKFYSNRNLLQVNGPITVVASRSRRITFMECPNTLTAMCDIAKVVDLVLLMVDGNYGFEMETFEFLNIAQVHGFPRMFGVVSHLDQLKTGKALKKRKKFLRHRFWYEVAAGAKLMCLSPMIRGMYRPNDILNLHRLLISVEPKVASWRQTHGCALLDRHEDITDPEQIAANPNCNRTVAFYGYSRGKPLKSGQMIHIPGVGDFPIEHLSHQDDPCEAERAGEGKSQAHRMRHLSTKQKKLYAPYCDVGGITYDDDAIYVQEDAEKGQIERSGEGLQLLRELQRANPMDAAKARVEVVRRPVVFRNEDTMELEMEERQRPSDDDEDEDEEDDELYSDDDVVRDDLTQDPTQVNQLKDADLDAYGAPTKGSQAIQNEEEENEGNGAGGLVPRLYNDPDTVRVHGIRYDWSNAAMMRNLKDLCVTGSWGGENGDDEEGEEDDDADEKASKGYDSEDEDFEAQIRGEVRPKKSVGGRRRGRMDGMVDSDVENEEDDGSDDDDSQNEDDVTAFLEGNKRGSNALAGVSYGDEDRHPKAIRSHNANNNNNNHKGSRKPPKGVHGDEDDDYDILNDDAEDGGKPTNSFSGDAELDGLISTFLNDTTSSSSGVNRGRGNATGGMNAMFLSENEDGITFADSKYGDHAEEENDDDDMDGERGRRGGPRDKRKANAAAAAAEAEENEMNAVIQRGGQLTEEQERLLKKKMEKKKAFDESYDAGGADDSNKKNMSYAYYHQINRKVEEKKEQIDKAVRDVGEDIIKKIQLVGYFSGLYLRIVVKDIPVEFLRHFDPKLPLIAGGLNAGEDEFRLVDTKLKLHRWYPKILKAQDPLLLSMGWRRIQTQPIFATEDPNGRCRYLKYTPMHMHCVASFYAPVVPPNTGFLAIPVRDQRTSNFRITCSGYTVGNDVTTSIVKKLKLTGTPAKVDKTTVFIKNMFSSDIEASKFVGAKLKAVSGVRGIIKSVLKGKNGLVRATFEDKIFMSDIVFIRAWKSVEPPKYCAIQRNLVDPEWVGMKSMRELRWEQGVPLQISKDSQYREIKRRHRVAPEEEAKEEKVMISRNLRMQLPFELKEAYIPIEKSTELQERLKAATTVAPEVREQRQQALLDAFSDKADAMQKKKDESKKRARERAAKEAERENEKYLQGLKKAKKETARQQEFQTQHKSRRK